MIVANSNFWVVFRCKVSFFFVSLHSVMFLMLLNVLELFGVNVTVVRFEWKMWHVLCQLHISNTRVHLTVYKS